MVHHEEQGDSGPELSVLIPVYSEEESLPPLVDRLCSLLDTLTLSKEVISIDDGSKDSGLAVMRK